MRTIPQDSNRGQAKSTEEITTLMQSVLDKANQHGATSAAVGVNYDAGFSVDVRMGEVETVAFSEDKSVSVTCYIGQRKGSASSTDTSLAAIESMVKAACEIAKVSAEDPCFGLADNELISQDYPDLALCHPWGITPPEAIDMALSCERQALSIDKRIANSDGVNLSTHCNSDGYATSHGFSGVVHSSRHSMSCSLIAKSGEAMQRDYDYTVARKAQDLLPIEQLASQAVERTVNRLGAKQVNTQKAPVLFSSRLSNGLIGLFINAISGANLYRKNTFLLDSLGLQIFPTAIKIYEQPHLLGALGSTPFDGEGIITRNNVFVEQGKVSQYVLNSYTARRLGLKTTANSGGVFNLTVDATAGGLQEVLKSMDSGLYVTELMGQGVNILTGDYSRGASGFWVENGKIQFPVEGVTIAGNLRDMYRHVAAIGNDINPNTATRCGSILISDMMIAGS